MINMKIGMYGLEPMGYKILAALRNRKILGYGYGYELCTLADRVADPAYHAWRMKYDSVHGNPGGPVRPEGTGLWVSGIKLECLPMRASLEMDWKGQGVNVVIDASDPMASLQDLEGHRDAGAGKVIGCGVHPGTFIALPGVNLENYRIREDHVVTVPDAAVTAWALALKYLQSAGYGIEQSSALVVRAASHGLNLMDGPSPLAGTGPEFWRPGRATLNNLIPVADNHAAVLGQAMPDLAGRLDSSTIQVPVAGASFLDIAVRTSGAGNFQAFERALQAQAEDMENPLVGFRDDAPVSGDLTGQAQALVYDALASRSATEASLATGGGIRLRLWFDAEWSRANRFVDLLRWMQTRA